MRSADFAPLLIRFGRVGDMVLQSPLLRLLHRRYGQPCLLLASGRWSTELYAASEDVEEVLQLRARHAPLLLSPARWALIHRLRRHSGPVYVSEDRPRHVAKIRRLLACAGIPAKRCVFIGDFPGRSTHWVDRLIEFGERTPVAFAPAGAELDLDALRAPRLSVEESGRADCARWLDDRGFSGRPIVMLQPGNKRAIKLRQRARDDKRAWPVSRWAALLRAMRMQQPDAVLMLCGSKDEASLLSDIREAAGAGAEIASADLPLHRSLALMQLADSMVSVDTGPAHMAAAVGCPLVVLYGDESRDVWGRRSAFGAPIVELGGPPARDCASAISIEEVAQAWSQVRRHRR